LRSSHTYEVNPTHEPIVIRYRSASSDALEKSEGCRSDSSPRTIPPTTQIAPPIIISIPAPTSGRLGRGAFREYSDALVHDRVAKTPTSSPDNGAVESRALVPISIAAPANPRTSPNVVSPPTRWRRTTRSTNAIHSGTSAITRDISPEGTVRSARTTTPLPPATSPSPTSAAAFHCGLPRRSPARSPRRTEIAYRTAPAMRNRMPAAINGGSVSFETRIAR
jgi:hypothetical protein